MSAEVFGRIKNIFGGVMDPVTLGGLAVILLVKAAEKVADRAADNAVEGVEGASGALFDWLRRKVSRRDLVENVLESPNPLAQEELRDVIDAEIIDPNDRQELARLVGAAKEQVSSWTVIGDQNLLNSGSNPVFNVTYGARDKKEAVSWRLEPIRDDAYVLFNTGNAVAYSPILSSAPGVEAIVIPSAPEKVGPGESFRFLAVPPTMGGSGEVIVHWSSSPELSRGHTWRGELPRL